MKQHIDVFVPDLGLSPEDVLTISCWLVSEGDVVVEGDRLVELATGEITFDVACPVSGRLQSIEAEVDEVIDVGDLLGKITPDDDDP
jgi:pyruvate dehydrogenase E2 component (dihydrolipoamide acetyltransferase)